MASQLDALEASKQGTVVRKLLRDTTPGDALVHYVVAQGIDVLVMGSHARSGVVRAMLGSVSDDVIRRASCAVAVVRTGGLPLEVRAVMPHLHNH